MEQDYYMLVKEGKLQYVEGHLEGRDTLLWIVTRNIHDAKRLANQWNKKGVRPARIGSVQDETFEGCAGLAIEAGALPAVVIDWNDDGTPKLQNCFRQIAALTFLQDDGMLLYVEDEVNGERVKLCPLFVAEQDGERLADYYRIEDPTIAAMPPQIDDAVENSPLIVIAQRAFKDGCRYLAKLEGWGDDGRPLWKVLADAETLFDD